MCPYFSKIRIHYCSALFPDLKVGTSVNCTEGVLFPNRKSATLPDWARNTHDQIKVQCGRYITQK